MHQARWLTLAALLAACGGTVRRSGSDGAAGSSSGGSSHVDPQPPGKSCEYDGNTYASGDVVPMGECSQCRCADGNITCLLLPCDPPEQGCAYQGQSYPIGASFPAADGCNTCSCQPDFSIACTEIGCSNTCQTMADKYLALVDGAAACTRSEECFMRLPDKLGCGCDRWVTANDMMLVYQATMIADQYEMQCGTDLGCPDCPPLQGSGFCVKGRCVAEALPK
jgi:hypothetical protein